MANSQEQDLIWLAANDYLRQGWAIFPIATVNTKLTGEHRLLSGKLCTSIRYRFTPILTTRQLRPETLRGRNIGIATGRISRLIVLDIDGENGLRSLQKLDLPPTRTVITPNGKHLYFKHPGADYNVPTSPNTLAEGIDVKGELGQVTAPPSVHPDGSQYIWQNREQPVAQLPDAIARLLTTLPPRSKWQIIRRYIYRKYFRHTLNALTGK